MSAPGQHLPGPGKLPGLTGGPTPPGLRRFLAPRPTVVPGERCEMCAESLGEEHPHLVDMQRRSVMCTCRGCYLLFTPEGAGAGRYRPVPDRYRYDPNFRLAPGQWDEMQIPVSVAFVFHNSDLERAVAFYPSPGGATESLLPLETWQEVMAANPAMADVAPDVEALLLRRSDQGVECYLVPIDACYDLVGRVRMHWKGFDGGEEVWTEIDKFFSTLRDRSEGWR